MVYKWHDRFRNGKKKSTEDDSRDGLACVVKMTIKDKVKDIIYTDLDTLKQQSLHFTEMTSGRYVSI